MTAPRYTKVLSLTQEENTQLEELNAKGVRTIEVFRAGLKAVQKQTQKQD